MVLVDQQVQLNLKTVQIKNKLKNIGTSKPLIDWRYSLKEAVKHDVNWSYDNPYIEDGVVYSSLEEKLVPETEILLDTSGS